MISRRKEPRGRRLRGLATVILEGLVLFLFAQASTLAAGSLGRIRVGEPFPAVKLPLLSDGSLVTMAKFRGKPTVLHVFASW